LEKIPLGLQIFVTNFSIWGFSIKFYHHVYNAKTFSVILHWHWKYQGHWHWIIQKKLF